MEQEVKRAQEKPGDSRRAQHNQGQPDGLFARRPAYFAKFLRCLLKVPDNRIWAARSPAARRIALRNNPALGLLDTGLFFVS